mgnify:CR=1 FL=1
MKYLKKHMAMERIVRALHSKARELQLELITEIVRNILKRHPKLERFVMGMGDCYFLSGDGDKVELSAHDDMADLARLIDEWELTDTPRMVYSDGTVLADW